MCDINDTSRALRLLVIRDKWPEHVLAQLSANAEVAGAGFVGSLGRGDADDWSDVDMLIMVPDHEVNSRAGVGRLPGRECVTLSLDARLSRRACRHMTGGSPGNILTKLA